MLINERNLVLKQSIDWENRFFMNETLRLGGWLP